MQRHHGEWRVSPLDDAESSLRELKSALALMTECDWRTAGCKTCQDVRCHKGRHSAKCRERVLPTTVPDTMWPVATTKRLLDTGADDARDDHESKRQKNSDGHCVDGTGTLFWMKLTRRQRKQWNVPICWRNGEQRNEHLQHR